MNVEVAVRGGGSYYNTDKTIEIRDVEEIVSDGNGLVWLNLHAGGAHYFSLHTLKYIMRKP